MTTEANKTPIIYKNSDNYTGDLLDRKRHGHGKYVYADGLIYDGDWVNDEKDGYGILTWPDGVRYEGGRVLA